MRDKLPTGRELPTSTVRSRTQALPESTALPITLFHTAHSHMGASQAHSNVNSKKHQQEQNTDLSLIFIL